MDHHGKVAKDQDNGIWSAHCTCDLVWDKHSQPDAFRAVHTHITTKCRSARRGFGFRADIAE